MVGEETTQKKGSSKLAGFIFEKVGRNVISVAVSYIAIGFILFMISPKDYLLIIAAVYAVLGTCAGYLWQLFSEGRSSGYMAFYALIAAGTVFMAGNYKFYRDAFTDRTIIA